MGRGPSQEGKVGEKPPGASNALRPHVRARHSGPSAVSKSASQPRILALTLPSVALLTPTPTPMPAQAGGSNGSLALSPSSLLKYLSDHYYQTMMYLAARSGEWKGQKAELLRPRCKG